MPDDPPPSGTSSDGSSGPSPEQAGAQGAGAAEEAAPAILTRKELLEQGRGQKSTGGQGRNRTWWYALGAIAAVVVGVGVAVVLTRGDKANAAKAAVVTTPTTHPAAPVATCPLTGVPAPGGVVPARPALGVKIGNYTGRSTLGRTQPG